MQISKYLLANERDALWGLTVSTIGHEKIAPGHLHEVMLTATISMLRKGAPSMSISCSITQKAKAGSRVPIAHAVA